MSKFLEAKITEASRIYTVLVSNYRRHEDPGFAWQISDKVLFHRRRMHAAKYPWREAVEYLKYADEDDPETAEQQRIAEKYRNRILSAIFEMERWRAIYFMDCGPEKVDEEF